MKFTSLACLLSDDFVPPSSINIDFWFLNENTSDFVAEAFICVQHVMCKVVWLCNTTKPSRSKEGGRPDKNKKNFFFFLSCAIFIQTNFFVLVNHPVQSKMLNLAIHPNDLIHRMLSTYERFCNKVRCVFVKKSKVNILLLISWCSYHRRHSLVAQILLAIEFAGVNEFSDWADIADKRCIELWWCALRMRSNLWVKCTLRANDWSMMRRSQLQYVARSPWVSPRDYFSKSWSFRSLQTNCSCIIAAQSYCFFRHWHDVAIATNTRSVVLRVALFTKTK